MAVTRPTAADPTSAPSAAARRAPQIRVRVSWCKSCGLCVDYCSRGVLEMREGLPKVVQADSCTRCLLCEAICPDFAIEVTDADTATEAPS